MEHGNFERRPGWGVRPLDWSEDTDSEGENLEEESAMDEKEFAKWVSCKWNLIEFDGAKAVGERKHEWERFSEQFDRIVSVRKISSSQKLQALQIQGGQYLNDIIKNQRKKRGFGTVGVTYEEVMSDLNTYFEQTCDIMQERSKFREMKMSSDESFVDFELRCSKQIKYCNYSQQQADEEMADALIRRSLPVISKTLRMLAPTFQSNIFAIIKQGTHLDNLRREDESMDKMEEDTSFKPVLSVREVSNRSRFTPYQSKYQNEREKPRNWVPKARNSGFSRRGHQTACGRCAEYHSDGYCRAKSMRCMKCRRWGHLAKCCKSTLSGNHESSMRSEAKEINQVIFETENGSKSNANPDEEN